MSKTEIVREQAKALMVCEADKERHAELMALLDLLNLREISPDDVLKKSPKMLMVDVMGRGKHPTFKNYRIVHCIIQKVTKCYATAIIWTADDEFVQSVRIYLKTRYSGIIIE